MKRIGIYAVLLLFVITLSAMAAHKFYVAVYQINHVPQKKVLQITSRIFIDDLENALIKKYNKKFYIGSSREPQDCNDYLSKYFAEKIHLTINGITKPVKFIGKEAEDDILVCYYTFPVEGKVNTIEIKNTTLFELFPEQQNIVHLNINNNKKSLLLTPGKPNGTIEY